MIWTLHGQTSASDERLAETMAAVPERTSIWALAFPALWLAWHRLWIALAAYLIASAFLFALLTTPYWTIGIALGGLTGLYVWLEGAQLRRGALERRGFTTLDLVEAPDAETAIMRGISVRTPIEPLSDRVPMRPRAQPDGFGMFGA